MSLLMAGPAIKPMTTLTKKRGQPAKSINTTTKQAKKS